jgi:hypothetical protein
MRYSLSIPHMRKKMGRLKRWHEDMVARFVEGTLAEIDKLLKENETRTDFVREAVARELRRRAR